MKKIIFLIMISCTLFVFGKDGKLKKKENFSVNKLTTSNNILVYNQDKFRLVEESKLQEQEDQKNEKERKSVFKAVLFSGVVPGSGEYYTESYWKSAVFAAIEIIAWAGYLTYDNKGDSKDRQMRSFGDQNWSEQRYWTKVYKLAVEKNGWAGPDVELTGDGLLTEDYIDKNKPYLRELEAGTTPLIPDGFSRFTHTLPNTKTQQYYEMIYKYLGQFGAGWKEVDGDWKYYDGGAHLNELTSDVSHYKSLRNKSNDFYRVAGTMGTVVLLNHLVSAFDAAFSARSYNRQFNYSFTTGQKYYAGEKVTTYGIALSW